MNKTHDMREPKYESGDDERCPNCRSHLDGYRNLEFLDGIIQVAYACPECGHDLVFNYYLDNIIDEGA